MELPQHLFNYVSSITPLVSVELIITCPSRLVLLNWRDDGLYGPGWHLPGGIVRHKESLIDRIRFVALKECGIDRFESCTFLQINQIMNPNRNLRGHFISLVYGLSIGYDPFVDQADFQNGSLGLFSSAPTNLIEQHRRFESLINASISGSSTNIDPSGNVCSDYFLKNDLV